MQNKRNLLTNNQEVCPICGSNHIRSISRITGYLAYDERFNPGKVCERTSRVSHNSFGDCKI